MSLTTSMDDDLKREFTGVCEEMGLSASAAVNVFARTVVRERRIPFEVGAGAQDQTAAGVHRGQRDFEQGRFVSREEYERRRSAREAVA